MKINFINPPSKAEFGKFLKESRGPAITKSGALYYPLWFHLYIMPIWCYGEILSRLGCGTG